METIYISTHNAQKRFFMTDDELEEFFEYLEDEITEQGYDFKYTTDEIVDDLSTSVVNDSVSFFYYDILKKTINLQTGVYPDYLMTAEILGKIVKQYDFETCQDEKSALDAINQEVYPETDIAELNKIVQRYSFDIKDEIEVLGFEKISDENEDEDEDEDEDYSTECYKIKFKINIKGLFEIYPQDFYEFIYLDNRLDEFFLPEKEESNLFSLQKADLYEFLDNMIDYVNTDDFYENCINGIHEKLLEWAEKNIKK